MSGDDFGDDLGEREKMESVIPDFLSDPIGALQRRRLPMILCFAAGVTVTVLAFANWVPVYTSSASVLITSQKISEDFVRTTVPEDTLDNVNALVGKVLSVENLSKLIDDLDLFPKVRDQVPRIELVNKLRSNVSAQPQTDRSRRRSASLVYEIAYESNDPREAAKVANALAALFVEASFDRRNQQAQQTTSFLRRGLEGDELELREHAKKLTAFRREHRGELPEELQSNLRKLDMLSVRRESMLQQISEKENRILTLSAPGSGAALSENEVLLGELRRELARESAAHTDEHPNVIALRARIARLEGSVSSPRLSQAQRAIVNTESRDIARLKEGILRIDEEMADLDMRIDNTPRVAEQLDALVLREQVLREDHLASMRKVEAAELAESLEEARQGAQVSVLDAAQLPSRPTSSRASIAQSGLLASLLLALGVGGLLELIDPVVIGTRQLKKLADSPLLGSLPDVTA